MSTATKEKPSVPLGSFIGKLTPKPVETPAKEKADAKPVVDVADTKPVEKPVEAAPDKPQSESATAPAKTETPTELTPADKPKEDVTEKRLKDTQKWGNEEHKARLEAERKAQALEAQLKRIEAKLDGTYEEPTAPSTEQVATDADTKGRIRASHKAAVRQYGEAFVMETVWNPDSPYQELQAKSPAIRARVMEADDPVLEAIAVVKEHQDAQKYGRTPEEIRKRMEAELVPKLKQDILDGLKTKPGPATSTLGNVRGGTERTEQKNEAPARLDFRAVFPWGASRN